MWRVQAPQGGKLEFKIDKLEIDSEFLNCENGYLQISEPSASGQRLKNIYFVFVQLEIQTCVGVCINFNTL